MHTLLFLSHQGSNEVDSEYPLHAHQGSIEADAKEHF